MDDLNLYDDLDEFQEQQDKKSKELQAAEEKYQESLKTIEELQEENKALKKNIKRIELGFQSLLDTARSEIKRKDKEIERLRKEKDDICFRRKLPTKSNHTKEESQLANNFSVNNPFKRNDSAKSNEFSLAESALNSKSVSEGTKETTETNKRYRVNDDGSDSFDSKRHRGNLGDYDPTKKKAK